MRKQPFREELAELLSSIAHDSRVVLEIQEHMLLPLNEERRDARAHGAVRIDHRRRLLKGCQVKRESRWVQ